MKEIEKVEIIKKKSSDLEDVTFKPHRFGMFVSFGILAVIFIQVAAYNLFGDWVKVIIATIISFICLKFSLTAFGKREEF